MIRSRSLEWRPAGICLALLVSFGGSVIAQEAPARATHLLGLENVGKNANGALSIASNALVFRPDQGANTQIAVASIQSVSSGEQDR